MLRAALVLALARAGQSIERGLLFGSIACPDCPSCPEDQASPCPGNEWTPTAMPPTSTAPMGSYNCRYPNQGSLNMCPSPFPTFTEATDAAPTCQLAVVGAGTGGLYTALRLVDTGKYSGSSICIFEMTERVGGRRAVRVRPRARGALDSARSRPASLRRGFERRLGRRRLGVVRASRHKFDE